MQHLSIKEDSVARLQKGYPWVERQALSLRSPNISTGELVQLTDKSGKFLAIAYYNEKSKLACRILTQDPTQSINIAFFEEKLSAALHRRQKCFQSPYYRLVHGESDNLPGLVIDRFDQTLVCQINTAGMEKLQALWLPALHNVLKPDDVILRVDNPIRQKEGLSVSEEDKSIPLEVIENNVTFLIDAGLGQKTGWFYDQRANRAWIGQRAKRKTVLDLYTYCGGFGLCAAKNGAAHVTLVDSSEKALNQAKAASEKNQFTNCEFIKAEVFSLLETFKEQGKSFDIVIVDPPAFIKSAKYIAQGLRGYEKLARLASHVVKPGGMLLMASCSHHASNGDFRQAVTKGIVKADRIPTLLRKSGADRDHPIHPLLPQSHYLKALTFKLS